MKASILITSAILLAGSSLSGRAAPWTFAVMGGNSGSNDVPGVNTQVISKIARDITVNNCRFVLVPGDLIPEKGDIQSQYAAWHSAMAPVSGANIPIYPVRGLHESAHDPGGAIWRTVFPNLPTNGPAGEVGLTYSFVFSNAFCVALDQYVRPHRINQAWLDAQFQANPRPHVFVFGNKPAFRVQQADCLGVNAAERDIFWASIRHAGGRLYFCSHDYLYNSAAIIEGAQPPIFQIVIGTGGAPLHRWRGKYFDRRVKMESGNANLFGYNLITVDKRAVIVEWKALLPQGGWKVLDSLAIRRPIRTPRPL